MSQFKLILALTIAIPAGALLGAALTLDNGWPEWWGLAVGVAIGVFFGLVFGGNPHWKLWDCVFGPEDPEADQNTDP